MKKMRNIWKIGLWTRAHNFHVISWGRMLCAHSHFNSVSQKCGDVLRGNNIFKYLIDCRRFSSTERNREREREYCFNFFFSFISVFHYDFGTIYYLFIWLVCRILLATCVFLSSFFFFFFFCSHHCICALFICLLRSFFSSSSVSSVRRARAQIPE